MSWGKGDIEGLTISGMQHLKLWEKGTFLKEEE